ncbi:cytochrome c oxidase assembly protein [Pseudonocardia sp. RS11V-5]|uniref:cytochrome c oxidase assembly protein n=1 Tax=Pseudonocardia terrae TaxID=2905831 RepID=UPI001E5E89F2|nr:cytochrome c oxidase assembly protein [Pseudonocardia terrae]MCE3554080.1 cytochrome c oxidase assembly protein [Pseudonocardia terrae]
MLPAAAGLPPLPPLTPLRLLTAWRFEPAVVAACLALGGAYAVGLRRWRRSGAAWPRGRVTAFALGVLLLALVGLSFIGVYDDTLFWVRALQNLVLLMVAPLFLAVGAPLTLAAAAVPDRWRPRMRRWFHGRTAQVLTFPFTVTILLVVPLLVLYLGPLYEQTLRSGVVSGLVSAVIGTCGFVYFWTRFRIDPTPRAGSYLVTLWITGVEMVGDAVLGVVLWLGPIVAEAWYAARGWGPGLRTDQLIGAGILWIGGDVVGLPFVGVVLHRFTREEEHKAREIDARLDREEAEAARDAAAMSTETATGRSAAESEPGPPQRSRLWWEDDPQLAERFRRHP